MHFKAVVGQPNRVEFYLDLFLQEFPLFCLIPNEAHIWGLFQVYELLKIHPQSLSMCI